MVLELSYGPMARFIRANGTIVRSMVAANSSVSMVQYMRENGWRVNIMEKASFSFLKERSTQAPSKMESSTAEIVK